MECHKCEWGMKVAAGEAQGVAFEDTPCARCELSESSAGTLEYDEGIAEAAAPVPGAPLAAVLPVGVMAEALDMLLSVQGKTLEVLRLRYRGWTSAEIALRLEMTAEAANSRFWRVLNQYPLLAALFPRVTRRGRPYPRKEGCPTLPQADFARGSERGGQGEGEREARRADGRPASGSCVAPPLASPPPPRPGGRRRG